MDSRVEKLLQDCERSFADRKSLESLWQEIALNFYPEMAEFTSTRTEGEEFAEHLSTSYPLLARRSLGDAFAALLRPTNIGSAQPGVWFSLRAGYDGREDTRARRWLEWAEGIQRRAMYDRISGFVRATKEGDHCFATFGNAPLSLELNRDGNALLYRCWHLRDVAWQEDPEFAISVVYRKWKPTATQLVDTFGARVHDKVKNRLREEPYQSVECRHIMIRTDKYEQRDAAGKKFNTPWVSIWVDIDNDHVMEEVGSHSRRYIIPRWVTVPGSQYASSPAVTAALPDARLIQAMTLTLLESAEKFADPPVVMKHEVVRTDIQLFAGGVTGIDAEYGDRLEDAIRPLYHPSQGQGAGLGLQMRQDIRDMLAKAFYLDSLSLPPAGTREMTAFEVGERISEWIRRAMPIFEPMEFEYNGQICEETFDLLMRNGAFGPIEDIPDSLRGKEIIFKFESPLHSSADRALGQKFLEAKAALGQAAEIDPALVHMLNAEEALRDVLRGVRVPATWTRSESEMAAIVSEQREEQEAQQMMAEVGEGAAAARDLGAAAKDFATADAA